MLFIRLLVTEEEPEPELPRPSIERVESGLT